MYLDIVICMETVTLFKALSDETRLRLVHLSIHFELNVNEIVSIMEMGQSRISRHLKILTDSCLLRSRRDGLWTFYSIAPEGSGHDFIEAVKYVFEGDPVFTGDLERAQRVLDQRAMESVRFFDAIAEDWEEMKRNIIGDAGINAKIISAVPECGTVVDLGCGTGDLLAPLTAKAGQVIGVEKSSRMLEAARRRFAGDGENVELRIGELEHLPVRDGEADAAVINMVLHHLAEPLKAIKEVYRLLKKGNVFIIADLLQHQQELMRERFGDRWLGFSIEEIARWLGSCGFEMEKTEIFDLKKKLKGFIIQSVKK